MDLTPYIASLREDFATAASAGDENTRRTAEVLAAALEPAARLAIMNALSDLAAEVTAAQEDHVVDVRLSGRDVQVVVTARANPHHDDPRGDDLPPVDESTAGGDMSRMTLRLFEQLKSKAEQAAAAQGVSLNTFVQQALQGALHSRNRAFGGKDWGQRGWGGPDRGQTGSRVHGWYEG